MSIAGIAFDYSKIQNMKESGNFDFRSTKGILIFILFCISVCVFIIISNEVVLGKEDWFDSRVFDFLKSNLSPQFIEFFKYLTFFGSFEFTFTSWVVLIFTMYFMHSKREALYLAILALTSFVMMRILKAFFARERPELSLLDRIPTYSFPSGHALCSVIFYFTIISLIWKSSLSNSLKWLITIFLGIIIYGIGVSRIVLRVHFASDVLGGFCFGVAYYILFVWFYNGKINSQEERLN